MPKNQGYEVRNLQVEGDAERKDGLPKKFDTLHIRYSFDADADETTAARWVMASLENYCTTVNTIRDSVKISYTIIYNGTTIRENEQMISGGGADYDMGDIGGCQA
jgi:putative redox protein